MPTESDFTPPRRRHTPTEPRPTDHLEAVFSIRTTRRHKNAWVHAAETAGMSLDIWVHKHLDRAAGLK